MVFGGALTKSVMNDLKELHRLQATLISQEGNAVFPVPYDCSSNKTQPIISKIFFMD